MEEKTMEFDLKKGEIELLRKHYEDKIFQMIRDFDEDMWDYIGYVAVLVMFGLFILGVVI